MSHAYTQAGKVLQMVHAHKVSLKNALLTTGDKPATLRKVYALVFETLKCTIEKKRGQERETREGRHLWCV